MNRTRRSLALVSVGALASVAALTSCSSSPGTGGSTDKPTVTLQMVESLTSPDRTKVIKKLLADFEAANAGIKVQLVSPPTEQADQKIEQMLQAGTGIDVLEVRDLTVGPFGTNGWLYDMTSDLSSWAGMNNLTENAKKFIKTQDGKSYFVPYGFYGLSLFYRTDLVKDAGFAGPPKSWDELLTQATKLQDPGKNKYGYAFRGGKNSTGQLAACIEAFNADNLDVTNAYKLKDGKTIFSSPEGLKAVDTYVELFKKASPPSSVQWGYPEMVEGFNNGSTAFLLQDPEVIATISSSKVVKKDQWNTAPLLVGPSGKAAQPMATAGWGVAKSSKNTKEAVKLVQFLSEGASTTFAKENSLVPILKSAGDDEFYKTGPWASYVTMTKDPQTYLSVVEPRGVAWWGEWMSKAQADFQSLLLGKMSSADMLKGWDTFWTQKWTK